MIIKINKKTLVATGEGLCAAGGSSNNTASYCGTGPNCNNFATRKCWNPVNGTETALINSNSTLSNRSTSHYLYNANYSVSLYFGLLFVLILSSIISFTWLNYSNVAIKSRKKKESRVKYHDSLLEMSNLDDRNEQHHQELDVNIHISKKKDINEKMILISLAFITCFINYGYLPGLYSVNFFFKEQMFNI